MSDEPKYVTNPADLSEKWLPIWESLRVFEARGLVDSDGDEKPSCSIVSMFPYPSGDLHMGHAEVYSIGDAVARYRRQRGFNVLNPIGWDSFGLPAENAALRRSLSPRDWTYSNIEVQAESFRRLGISFDWRTRLHTSDPSFYQWNQWLFLQMYSAGLAVRKEAPVNWCPKDLTVLANEQVINGRCERCGSEVTKRSLTQWFLRTTAYAQRLLDDMRLLENTWPKDVLAIQRNWIGRSSGARIRFAISGCVEPLEVFTTRPETLFGATFIAVAPDSPAALELCARENADALDRYRSRTATLSEIDRLSETRPRSGVFLGVHATNPLSGDAIPVIAADYVLSEYGTGAIMGVPAHDERDQDLADALGLPSRVVIQQLPNYVTPSAGGGAVFGDVGGRLINSGMFTGLEARAGGAAIVAALKEAGMGSDTVTYRLRDWLISRQRYWGTPIPIIHCSACGIVPVPAEDLPVLLPEDGFELRSSDGRSPLQTAENWRRVPCPRCGGLAERDTDTMDTFVDSSWYFLRYSDPSYSAGPFNPAGVAKWLPVDLYIGGREHATGHLMYARFITKVLSDLGLVPFSEPFERVLNQGQVLMNGKAMSKTLGNLVELQQQIKEHGPDAVRVTMLFAGPPEDDIDWADVSARGSVKWLNRVLRHVAQVASLTEAEGRVRSLDMDVHSLIAKTTEAMDHERFNVAISRLMELTTVLRRAAEAAPEGNASITSGTEALVTMLSCFAPFTSEEAWELLGHQPSVVTAVWPAVESDLIKRESTTCVIQVNGKVRDKVTVPSSIAEVDLIGIALASARVAGAIGTARVTKIIARPPRVVNVVTAFQS